MNEQTNAALARWMRWKLNPDRAYWLHNNDYTGYGAQPTVNQYFNPIQRIDHAWLLIEKAPSLLNQHDWGFFMYWFMHADLYSFTAERAAHEISKKIIEIAGITV